MHVEEALIQLKNFDPVIVLGKTFEPETIDTVRLESGENIFWFHAGENTWLSVDPDSEEVISFSNIEEELSGGKEVKLYAGEEYEFSYESSAKVMDEEGEQETVSFRDYESSEGNILRIMQYEISGDRVVAVGQIISEEMLQQV